MAGIWPGAVRVSRVSVRSDLAIEAALGLPAAVTVAAYVEKVANDIQDILSTQNLREHLKGCRGGHDGGVIKNVIAIAAGISDGLGLAITRAPP